MRSGRPEPSGDARGEREYHPALSTMRPPAIGLLGSIAVLSIAVGCASVTPKEGADGAAGSGPGPGAGGTAGPPTGAGGRINITRGVCGNGDRTADEACDDGNTVSDDGCSADCKVVEQGYSCQPAGQ